MTLLPALAATGELKTKPTQHSVKELRGIGIQPDVIVLRSRPPGQRRDPREDRALHRRRRRRRHPGRDGRDDLRGAAPCSRRPASGELHRPRARPGRRRRRAGPRRRGGRWSTRIKRPEADARDRARRQVHRAARRLPLGDRGAQARRRGRTAWTRRSAGSTREELTADNLHERLDGVDGMLVPGGFGHRGIEGKVLAAHYAREHGIPYLGLCLGLQCARDRVRPRGDRHRRTRTRPSSTCSPTNPVIDFMPDQRDIEDKGGTMRLGLYPAQLLAGLEGAPRSTARRSSTSATATASRSTTATARPSRAAGHAAVGAVARRPARRDRRAARTTRGSSRASSTRSSRAGRSGRTRCSPGS